MSIGPVTHPLSSLVPSAGTAAAPRATDVPFSQVVSNLLSEANQQQLQVGTEVHRLVSGESENIHDVVLSVARADLAFRMVMEIRDQLIDSYHEIMRMQV